MMADERVGAGAAAYRGFLFSDLRGFTTFAERYGNSAAAAKVGRFLEISRRAIAHHEGAEIKTEGDAIHAVFPSASAAVLCGLEIVDAAAELNAPEPDRPIALGVGVHAGEAVETPEGYIGSAVNLAARVCAIARPGEVLVTATVKSITQASIPVGFIGRGRRRLKGIREPVEVYTVTRDATVTPPRRVPRSIVVGAAGIAVAVLALAIGGSILSSIPGPGPSATADGTTRPIVIGALPIGRYASREFQPPVSFDIVAPGWTATGDAVDGLSLIRETSPRGGLSFLRVDAVVTGPCVEGGEGAQTGPGAADIIDDLSMDHLTLSEVTLVEVGGSPGHQVDVTVSDGALAACGGQAGDRVPIFVAGDEVWHASPGERFRLFAVDVRGRAVTLVLSSDWTEAPPSIPEWEELLQLGQRLIDSVGF